MDEPAFEERLTAILAADAAGYSRLMAADQRATLASLDAARAVFRREVEHHQGRVIDTAGDSVLATFATATGAVSAAIGCQRDIAAAAEAMPIERQMLFRIGVHLGDVIVKPDGTVYGTGVNVAARLQALAQPGGICVSDAVRTAVRDELGANFADLGEHAVKNIPLPIRAYGLASVAPAHSSADGVQTRAVAGADPLTLPDKPSIAVLPFANMSGDPEQEYFTDGITEDIITELSRFRSLFVIARNSTFTYKGKAVDVRAVAKELGVRYVLEGSIRRGGQRVRVTAQLIDAESGNHIWAERYDRVVEEIFDVQEELTQAIVAAIAPHIETHEGNRTRAARPTNLNAYEIAMRAWAAAQLAFKAGDRAGRDEAIALARRALAVDACCGAALRTIALAQRDHVVFRTTGSVELARKEGIEAATRAIEIDNADHFAYLCKGMLLFTGGQSDAARVQMRRAHELNPNDARVLSLLGLFEALTGNSQAAIDYTTRALRLSPRDPSRYWTLTHMGWAYFSGSDYASALEAARSALAEAPSFPSAQLCLVVSLVGLGDIDAARTEYRQLQRVAPKYAESRLCGHWVLPDVSYGARGTGFLQVAAGIEQPARPVTVPPARPSSAGRHG